MAAPKEVTVLHAHHTDGKTKRTWHVAAFLDASKARSAASTLKLLHKVQDWETIARLDPKSVPDGATVPLSPVTFSATTLPYNPDVTIDDDGDSLAG